MSNVVETIFRGVDEISESVSKISESMTSLQGLVKGVGEALVALFAAEKLKEFVEFVVETTNKMHELDGVIRQVTTSSQNFQEVQAKLVALSIQTEAPLKQTVEFYARLTQATQSLGYTESQRITIVRSMNDVLKLAGPLAGDVSLQFNRMLLTGELSGRGLVEIFTRAPQLAQLLAEHLGVTIDKLKELGEAGKLGTETVLDALVTRSDTVRKKAEEMGSTTTEAFTNLGTVVAAWLDRFEQKFHLIQLLASGINYTANALAPSQRSPQEALKELIDTQQKIQTLTEQMDATRARTGGFTSAGQRARLAELEALEKSLIVEQQQLQVERDKSEEADKQAKAQRVKHDAEVAAAAEKELAAKGQELSPALEEFIAQLKQGYDLTKSMRTEFEKQIEDLHDAQLKFSVGVIDEDTLKRVEDAMLQPIVVTAKRKKEVQQDIQDISESWKQAERNMETALANWFATFDGGLKGLVRSFADTMRKLIAEALAAKVMEKIFGFSKSTATQGGTGSGASGVIATLLGTLFGGPRASGGWTTPGAIHSINESEPEFLISSDRSRVVPLSKAAANGIGGSSGVFAPNTVNHITTTMSPFELDAYMKRNNDQLLARFLQMRRDGVFQ